MNNSFSYLCLHLLLFICLDAVALKLIPAERNVVKKDGATHTISRYYVVPKDFDENRVNGSETVTLAAGSNSRSANSKDSDINVTLEANAPAEGTAPVVIPITSKRANPDGSYTLDDIDIRFNPVEKKGVSLSHQLGLGQASANQALGNFELGSVNTPLNDNKVNNDNITYSNNGKFGDEPLEPAVYSNNGKFSDKAVIKAVYSNNGKFNDKAVGTAVYSNNGKFSAEPVGTAINSNNGKFNDKAVGTAVYSNNGKFSDAPVEPAVYSNNGKFSDEPVGPAVYSNNGKFSDEPVGTAINSNDGKFNGKAVGTAINSNNGKFSAEPVGTAVHGNNGKFGDKAVGTTINSNNGKFSAEPVGTAIDSKNGKFNDKAVGTAVYSNNGKFSDEPVGTAIDSKNGKFNDKAVGTAVYNNNGKFSDEPVGTAIDSNSGKFSDKVVETVVNADEEKNKFVSTDLRVLFDQSADLNTDNFWRLFNIYVSKAKKSDQLVRIEKLFVLANIFTNLYKATKVNIPIDAKIDDIVMILQNGNNDPDNVKNRNGFQVDPQLQNVANKLSTESKQVGTKPCKCRRKCLSRMAMDDWDSTNVPVSETGGRTDFNLDPNLPRRESKADDVNVWVKMPPSYPGINNQAIKIKKRLFKPPYQIESRQKIRGIPGYKVKSLSKLNQAHIGRENGIYEDPNLNLDIIDTAQTNKQPFVVQQKSRIGLPLAGDKKSINGEYLNIPFIDDNNYIDSTYQPANIEARQTANPSPIAIEDRQGYKQDPHPPIFEARQNFNQGIVTENRQSADLPWAIEDRQNTNQDFVIEDRQNTNKDFTIEDRQNINKEFVIEDRQNINKDFDIEDRLKELLIEDRQNINTDFVIEDRQNINKDFVIEDRQNINKDFDIEDRLKEFDIEDRIKEFVIEDRQSANLPWVIEDRQKANLPWVIEDRQKANLPWVIEDRQKANLPWVIEDRQKANLPWVIEDRQKNNLPWVIEDRQNTNNKFTIEDRENNSPLIIKNRIRGRPGLDIKSSLVKPHVYHTYIINPTKILYGEKPEVPTDLLKILSGKYKNNYHTGIGYDISSTQQTPRVSKFKLLKKPSGGYYESEISLSNGKQRPIILQNQPGYRESVVKIESGIDRPGYDINVDGSNTFIQPGGFPNGYESNTEVHYEEDRNINPYLYSNQPSYESSVNLEYNRPVIDGADSEIFYNKRPSNAQDTRLHIDLQKHTFPINADTEIASNYENFIPTRPFNTYEKEQQIEIGGNTDYDSMPIVRPIPNVHTSSYVKLQKTPVTGYTDVNSEVYLNQPSSQTIDLQYNKNPNYISYYEHKHQVPTYNHVDRLRAQLAPSYKLFSVENLLRLQDALIKRRQFNNLGVYEERALANLNKINTVLLILAKQYQKGGNDISNIWYENIFFNGGNIQKHPLKLYVYNLIRQKWLHEIMLLLNNNNFNLNILNNPKLYSFLGTWHFPNNVLQYLETNSVVVNQQQRPYSFEDNFGSRNVIHDNFEANSIIADDDDLEPSEFIESDILDNYVPENEGLILSITGLDVGLDADAIINILKKYMNYQNYVERQESSVSRGNKVEMFKKIVVFLREKGYDSGTILDLIHKLYRAVYRVEGRECSRNQVNDFVQNAYDVILPVLRRSGR